MRYCPFPIFCYPCLWKKSTFYLKIYILGAILSTAFYNGICKHSVAIKLWQCLHKKIYKHHHLNFACKLTTNIQIIVEHLKYPFYYIENIKSGKENKQLKGWPCSFNSLSIRQWTWISPNLEHNMQHSDSLSTATNCKRGHFSGLITWFQDENNNLGTISTKLKNDMHSHTKIISCSSDIQWKKVLAGEQFNDKIFIFYSQTF